MQAVLIALGGNVALLAVIAFLGQRLIVHWLDKDLGRFKQDLEHSATLEVEALKGRLQVAANEHAILLTKLQERRAEVIGTLYGGISRGVRALESYVRPMQWAGEEPLNTKATKARTTLMETFQFFEDNRVWLTEDCARLVEEFLEDLRQCFNPYDVFRQDAERNRHDDDAQVVARNALMAAWDRLTGDPFAAAKRALEAEMRRLLEPAGTRHNQPA